MSDAVWGPKDVFISYKRDERSRVVRMGKELEGLGLTVWFDAALEPGASFDEEIAREVSGARAVLVCWSKGSVASRWVRSEAMIAANRRVLVPVFLEMSEPLPPFNLDHAEDLSDWAGEDDHQGWRKVLARVGTLTGRGDALVRWIAARGADQAKVHRRFIADFPTDPLANLAKQRVWVLESEAMRLRLSGELGIQAPMDPIVQEVEELRARLEVTTMRAENAEDAAKEYEAKVTEYRQAAERAIAERDQAQRRFENPAKESEAKVTEYKQAVEQVIPERNQNRREPGLLWKLAVFAVAGTLAGTVTAGSLVYSVGSRTTPAVNELTQKLNESNSARDQARQRVKELVQQVEDLQRRPVLPPPSSASVTTHPPPAPAKVSEVSKTGKGIRATDKGGTSLSVGAPPSSPPPATPPKDTVEEGSAEGHTMGYVGVQPLQPSTSNPPLGVGCPAGAVWTGNGCIARPR